MSKRKDGTARGKYTLEFKLEAVRLEQHTCECYAVAKKEYHRLLPMPLAA